MNNILTEGPVRLVPERSSGETALFQDCDAAILDALGLEPYVHILEIDCARGDLARKLVMHCSDYTGTCFEADHLEAARASAPLGRVFLERRIFDLPDPGVTNYDCVVLSRGLDDMGPQEAAQLGRMLDRRLPDCPVLVATRRSGGRDTSDSLRPFISAMPGRDARVVTIAEDFRIDLISPTMRLDGFIPERGDHLDMSGERLG